MYFEYYYEIIFFKNIKRIADKFQNGLVYEIQLD